MHFEKYQSLINEGKILKTITENASILEEDGYATEKIHGANFSYYIWEDPSGEVDYRFASRSNLLPKDTGFYKCNRFFTDELINYTLSVFNESIKPRFKGIRLVGELFGGDSVGHIKPVQSEIKYKTDICFRVFQIQLSEDSTFEKVTILPFPGMLNLTNRFGLETVPVIQIGKIKDLLQLNPDSKSKICDDIQEGVVIQTLDQSVTIKNRSKNFLEIKGTIKNPGVELPEDVVNLLSLVSAYATEQRVSNVNSHHGFNSIKDFSNLMSAVMEDVSKDILEELNIDLNAKGMKLVRGKLCSMFSTFIKEMLLK